jgi:sn-glycerol 3-phosphate transport system substrate-binding protein
MTRRCLTLLAVLALFAAACGDSGSDGGSQTTNAPADSLPACPLDALTNAKKPVEINYWHAMTRANEETLQELTTAFNAEQKDVHVTLSAAASYSDNFTRFKSGLTTGALPDLLQGDDTTLQALIDSQATLPVASCIKADNATTADLLPRVVSYYSVRDVLWPMPFNNSNLVLYYNRRAFEKAGLDPDKPPRTLEDAKTASQQIVRRGAAPYGMALKTDAPIIEHWLAKAGHTLVNNGNGREQRATAMTLDDATGVSLFQWLDDMVTAKLALSTGTGDIDHYLAVGNGRAAMTIDTSAALGTISQLFAAGQYQDIQLGVGPMPGPASPDGGILVGGAANYIVNRSDPEQQAAAYTFAKYLASPRVQARWAAATGYTPISTSAVTMQPLAQQYARQPEYRVAYDQLLAGEENAATAGAVIGAYGAKGQGVRGAIIDAFSKVVDQRSDAADAVREATTKANAAIEEYNSRVG